MKEKRVLERFDLRIPTQIRILNEEGDFKEGVVNLFTENICSGGAFFDKTNSNGLSEGTKVMMDMTLQSNKPKKSAMKPACIRVSGSVSRSSDQGLAIRFDEDYEIRPLTN